MRYNIELSEELVKTIVNSKPADVIGEYNGSGFVKACVVACLVRLFGGDYNTYEAGITVEAVVTNH